MLYSLKIENTFFCNIYFGLESSEHYVLKLRNLSNLKRISMHGPGLWLRNAYNRPDKYLKFGEFG